MTDLSNIWDFAFLWEAFAYFLKISAPFLMIIIAIIATGTLLIYIVKAVRSK